MLDPALPFGPAATRWFAKAFAAPTPVQREGWAAIARREDALLLAPTGSGKTLAAFLWAIDRLHQLPADAPPGVRVLYVSPLKALIYDVERNLRAPLAGVRGAAGELGSPWRDVSVAVRTGDTPSDARRRFAKDPADVLITTPESLFLILGSQARAALETVDTIIVDEVHSVAGTKRGVHLALSLERVSELAAAEPQRLGLSATVRPADEVARFLGGADRPVTVVDATEPPRLDLEVVVPVEDMDAPPPPAAEPAREPGGPLLRYRDREEPERPASPRPPEGVWPAIYPRILELIQAHRSTIVFVNSRILAERLAARLNELAGEELVLAHHGSLAHPRRTEVEERLKGGRLRGIVATSSLELGIDMGAVDLVVQVASPGAASRGLQRVGRSGHGVGETSRGRIFPKYKGDLLEAAVVARQMLRGAIEPLSVPRRCLDVLAQHVVSLVGTGDPLAVDDLLALVRRAYPYAELTRAALEAVLDMLSGRYPSDEFADLRPALNWDRTRGRLTGRRHARMLAALNAGTIPDRGLYGVFLGEGGPRVGELDEEMVHESRQGETFVLGASTWRITDITRDRVLVEPAPGEPGKLPFWKGDGPGRPLELGRALGALVRELGAREVEEAAAWLQAEAPLDARAAGNLARFVHAQREATGVLPTDRTVVVERFPDELGDWRVVVHTPFGARVHAPWGLALEALLARRAGFDVQTIWTDDGVVLRFADSDDAPGLETLVPDPDEVEVEDLVVEQLRSSPMFAARFRENAGRALLLPRRRPTQRTPLWAQRLRSESLLAAAGRYPSFPIVLETYRECLQDVFDLPALVELLRAVRRRELQVVEVVTERPSPFARSLVFAYVAAFMYAEDAPLAERKAHALSLDRELLRDLLGQEELRDLLDPAVLDEVVEALQGLAEGRRARHADGLHDLLRRVGDLTSAEAAARSAADPAAWLEALEREARAVRLRIAGEERWVAVEDVARYRDALGCVPPGGVPAAFLEPAPDALPSLLLRYARTHGPFTTGEVAARFDLRPAVGEPLLAGLEREGRLHRGELRPGGLEREWCDPDVLARLRRRTLAKLRAEVAPVDAPTLGRFLPAWQGVGPAEPVAGGAAGERLREAIEPLEGLALPFSALEGRVLPARVPGYGPGLLDDLGARGELVWVGRAPLGGKDGKVVLCGRERVGLLLDPPPPPEPRDAVQEAILAHLDARGASFLVELSAASGRPPEAELRAALWDLVWAGQVTNDTFGPLRELAGGAGRGRRGRRARSRAASGGGGRWTLVRRLAAWDEPPTVRAHARAEMLLERYGVVAREAAAAEELPGGFAAVYAVLKAMEEAGRVRRGYFVEGLGGAQFALPGAVERLRARRDDERAVRVLAAVDPANPFGALLPWAETPGGGRPRRVAGAEVVLVGGAAALYLEAGGRGLLTFPDLADDPEVARAAAGALRELRGPRRRSLRIERIDGEPARESERAGLLREAGFVNDYRGLALER